MSNDNQVKREFVAAMYASPRWKKRVSTMSDGQVFAIWKREQVKAQEAAEAARPKKTQPSDEIPF